MGTERKGRARPLLCKSRKKEGRPPHRRPTVPRGPPAAAGLSTRTGVRTVSAPTRG